MGPVGADIRCQFSSPSKIRAYSRVNISTFNEVRIASFTSSAEGHSSRR